MPRKKLTLSVEEHVIERAKRFARRQEVSVSELVTRILASLDDESEPETPIVSRLTGVLKGPVSTEDYRRHLERKHGG